MTKRLLTTILTTLLTAIGLQAASSFTNVKLTVSGMTVTMSNGKTTIKIGSNGRASSMKWGSRELLDGSNGIYFDYTTAQGNKALSPSELKIIKQTDEMCEVLYSATSGNTIFQQGYIMRNDIAGVYTYVIATGTATSASEPLKEVRVCTRLASDMLNGYVDYRMNGKLPTNAEMAEAEKNQIQDATYYLSDGSVYTKYNWANFIERDTVHGVWNNNSYGVWNIPVSYEWLNGACDRQELMVHATSKSPITIQMLQGEHLGGAAMVLDEGEKKLFGPFLIYANYSTSPLVNAKRIALEQQKKWPFQWFDNDLYPKKRGNVTGHLNVATGQRNDSVRIVLTQESGTELVTHTHGYNFWTTTDANGDFILKNVRPGKYTLYAYALAGDVTDELQMEDITIGEGEQSLGTIDWTPKRYAKLHWMIGENNRRSDGFHYSDTVRQYGLWNLPPDDLTYVIGASKPEKDWYYAQTKAGTWTVRFNLDELPHGNAVLTASLAGCTNAGSTVKVNVNGKEVDTWKPGVNDAAIYRSAVNAGRHWLFSTSFSASKLKKGTNIISFTMSGNGKNGGFLYDCVKLESGEAITSGISDIQTDIQKNNDTGKNKSLFNLTGQRVTSSYRGVTVCEGGKKVNYNK